MKWNPARFWMVFWAGLVLSPILPGQELKLRTTLDGAGGWCLAFSPDGKWLASERAEWLASERADRTVKLWEVGTWKLKATLKGHKNNLRLVAFSPDNRLLASVEDGIVKVWDVQLGKEKISFSGSPAPALCSSFSPDSKLFAVGRNDQTVTVWDLATGRKQASFVHPRGVTALAFSLDGVSLAAVGTTDGEPPLESRTTILLWDTSNGKTKATLEETCDRQDWWLAFQDAGKTLALGSADKAVRLWDLASLERKPMLVARGKNRGVLAFSPDRKVVAIHAKADGEVVVLDRTTGDEIGVTEGNMPPQIKALIMKSRKRARVSSVPWVMSAAISPDRKLLATGNEDGTMKVWEIHEDGKEKR